MKKQLVKLSVSIIGLGHAGHHLAACLKELPSVELVAGVDHALDAQQRFTDRFGGVRVGGDIESMVAQLRPDVVVVATPNDLHVDHITRLVISGIRNIFCEKPLAISFDEARRAVELSEREGVRTGMGFMGCHPGVTKIVDAVHEGKLGRVLSAHVHSYRGYGFWGRECTNARGNRTHHGAVAHPDRSGGWTIHHACHAVFTLMSIAGKPSSVYGALSRSSHNCPSEELIHATFGFDGGAVGHLIDSIGSHRGFHCGVIGTRGTMMFHDPYRKRNSDRFELSTRMEGNDCEEIELIEHSNKGGDRLSQFIEAVACDRPSTITFREAIENLEVCNAIVASHQASTVETISLKAPPRYSCDPAAYSAVKDH